VPNALSATSTVRRGSSGTGSSTDLASRKHLGDVYLNGASFYEVSSRAEVNDPPLRTEASDNWTRVTDPIRDPKQTQYVWYAEVSADETTIWANFQGADPNSELVEINVRPAVFFPTEHHHYTPGGQPAGSLPVDTAYRRPARSDRPELGKAGSSGQRHPRREVLSDFDRQGGVDQEEHVVARRQTRYQYQIESVFCPSIGWTKRSAHVIRAHDPTAARTASLATGLHDLIEANHIYNIATGEFYGYEIGGIKLHAAIDVTIRNRIHDCTLGWLIGKPRGPAFRNLFHGNNRDCSLRSHGPYLVEHNILASPAALELWRRRIRAQPDSARCGSNRS
jgi:hypothetical protein